MNAIIKVHNYLETLPEVGKVQSLATLLKIGKLLNKGEKLDVVSAFEAWGQKVAGKRDSGGPVMAGLPCAPKPLPASSVLRCF